MHRVQGKFAILFDAIHMVREHQQNAIQYLHVYEGQSKISESCFISEKLLLVWVVFV